MKQRDQLAREYAIGKGIEIGAFHTPWPLPDGSSVEFVDTRDRAALLKILDAEYDVFPRHKDAVPETDHICAAETLDLIGPATQDFVLASHVLEHCFDPLMALRNWLRVLKPGGHILMAVPEAENWLDKNREVTSLDFLKRIYRERDPEARRGYKAQQFREYFIIVEQLSGERLEQEISLAIEDGADVHFNVWSHQTYHPFLQAAEELLPELHHIETFVNGAEFLTVLKKQIRKGNTK